MNSWCTVRKTLRVCLSRQKRRVDCSSSNPDPWVVWTILGLIYASTLHWNCYYSPRPLLLLLLLLLFYTAPYSVPTLKTIALILNDVSCTLPTPKSFSSVFWIPGQSGPTLPPYPYTPDDRGTTRMKKFYLNIIAMCLYSFVPSFTSWNLVLFGKPQNHQ